MIEDTVGSDSNTNLYKNFALLKEVLLKEIKFIDDIPILEFNITNECLDKNKASATIKVTLLTNIYNFYNIEPLRFQLLIRIIDTVFSGYIKDFNTTNTSIYPYFEMEKLDERIYLNFKCSVYQTQKHLVEKNAKLNFLLSDSLRECVKHLCYDYIARQPRVDPIKARSKMLLRLPHEDFYDQPYDSLFATYDANVVYQNNTNIYAVGSGPADRNGFIALCNELLKNFQNKDINIISLGSYIDEFYNYLINDQFDFDGTTMVVTHQFHQNSSSTNILHHSLTVNSKYTINIYNVISMPDGHVATLENSDFHLLSVIFNKINTLQFFHCRAGMGRSASFAFLSILFSKLEEIIDDLQNIQAEAINEETLAQKIAAIFFTIRIGRRVMPLPLQMDDVLQFAYLIFNMTKLQMQAQSEKEVAKECIPNNLSSHIVESQPSLLSSVNARSNPLQLSPWEKKPPAEAQYQAIKKPQPSNNNNASLHSKEKDSVPSQIIHSVVKLNPNY